MWARPDLASREASPWAARTMSALSGGGQRPSRGLWLGAERDRAESGIDGVYEPWAQLLDPAFLAPRLHVWGTLGEFALVSAGLEFLSCELGCGSSLQPQMVLKLIMSFSKRGFSLTPPPTSSRSPLLFSHSPEFVSFK